MLKRSLETQKTPDVQKTTDVEEGPSHRRQRIQSPEIHPIGEPPKDVQMGRKIGAMASPDYMPVSRDQTPTDSRDQTPKPPETPKEVITDKSRMFEFAYNTAETRYSADPQLVADLKTIHEFEDDESVKAAMSRLANRPQHESSQRVYDPSTNPATFRTVKTVSAHENKSIARAITLITHNPMLREFYRSTSSLNEGLTRAEPSSSQDTDNTTQKKRAYLDKIPDKTIMDLARILMKEVEPEKRSQSIRHACNRLKLYRGLIGPNNLRQMQKKYGESITREQAITAAMDLRKALNPTDIDLLIPYRDEINRYYQDVGLSDL